jgi:DNA repair exonuclease SbcCD ATPase subunit
MHRPGHLVSADLRARIAELESDLSEATNHRDGYERECNLWAEQAENQSYRRWLAWQSARRGRATAHTELAALLAETTPQLTQTAARLDAIEKLNARATDRAEQLAAELEQWRACFGETALKDARGVLAERDQLRAAVERVAKQLDYLDLLITTMGRHNPTTSGIFAKTSGKIRAALDQAPAAEQETDRRRILRELTQDAVEAGTYGEPAPAAEQGQATLNREPDVQASTPRPEPAAEQDGGGQ